MNLIEREIKGWMFVPFTGIMLMLIFGAMNWYENRVINKIVVKGNNAIQEEEILRLASVKIGSKLSSLNLSEIRSKIESHDFVKQAEIYVNLPDVLFIEVFERKPIAMMTYGNEIYYVDSEGKVIPFDVVKKIFPVPLLSDVGYKPINIKLDSADQLRKQIEIIKVAMEEKVYDLISEVKIKNNEFVLLTSDGAVFVFLGDGDFKEKFVLLKEFWNQVVSKRGYPVYIDLRYEGKIYAKFN
ncbi:MAG: FtsQ-type POTRA domain-containing protein [Candidatus Kryptonium sp.]|nr:FtsQ-type POTRA domain-containing protein [Candidatus Kryptonium sp.]MCX7762727.1 FtsQ-type POTRA domain-containing protein [Candidatus Kryptonium sp.]MDW8108615.1 FtsQ-type POTRA domain-containing protein [Candidatus Kryptonium sp.]